LYPSELKSQPLLLATCEYAPFFYHYFSGIHWQLAGPATAAHVFPSFSVRQPSQYDFSFLSLNRTFLSLCLAIVMAWLLSGLAGQPSHMSAELSRL